MSSPFFNPAARGDRWQRGFKSGARTVASTLVPPAYVCLATPSFSARSGKRNSPRFLQIAQSAAVKGAVFLDLGVERAFLLETEATEMPRWISAMVAGF